MHISTLNLILGLATIQLVASAPTAPALETISALPELEIGSTPNVNVLEARATDSCIGRIIGCPDAVSYIHWGITINTPYDNQVDGCGRGFLDNFRGRCGVITNWGCTAVEPGRAIYMDFWTHAFCENSDITEAMKAASGGRSVGCRQTCFD